MRSGTVWRAVVLGAALLAGVGGVRAAAARLAVPPPPRDASAELVYLPDAALLRPLGLGWDNVLADLLWFRTISYFGRHYQADRAYPWLARMCDLVTDLDPRAEHVYRFAGFILPWEADAVDDGLRLLAKGTRALPASWLLRYQLGITRYVFTTDVVGAAEDLRVASTLPGAPPQIAGMAAALHARQHGPETTVAFLREMLRRTESAEARAVIQERLLDAQLALDLERLDAAVATYRARTGRAPASLHALVDAGMLRGVPPDPFGGAYELDPATGAVRSTSGRTPRRAEDSPRRRARLEAAAPATE